MRRSLEVLEQVAGCRACDPRMVDARNGIVLAMPGKRYERGGFGVWADYPSEADDASGRPFTATVTRGRPNGGEMFKRILAAAGIDREDVLVGTRVRCRPPRSRMGDYPEALTNCEPWNVAEFEAYAPAVVVVMGRYAMEPVYGANPKVGELQGTWRATGDGFAWGSRLWLATYTASAVAQNPDLLESVADDFRRAFARWQEITKEAP